MTGFHRHVSPRVSTRLSRRRTALALAAATALGPWAASPALAALCTWQPTSGNWGSAANWSCSVVPTGPNVDQAVISFGQLATINDLDGNSQFRSIYTLNNAGTLNIDAFGLNLWGGGSTTNSGILNVGGASTAALQVSGGHNIDNTGGVINVGNGSVINQFGSSIGGGTIHTAGSGALVVFSSGSNFLSNVVLNGVMDMTSVANARQRIVNGATINGSVNIANGGVLSLDSASTAGGNQTLAGAAVINLNDAGARLSIDGSGTTTLGTGITVRGQGNIGQAINVGGNNTLVNNGLVSADVNGGTLNITAPASGGGSSFVNNGTLQAVNGGALLLSTNIRSNAGSQIVAGSGSSVVQNGVTLNGLISVNGSGSFQAVSSGSNYLDGVTFSGVLDMSTIANARERIVNGATFNGAVLLANGGVLSLDSASGAADQTLSGTAVIHLNDPGARLAIDGSGSTTLGAGITVRGQGNIGQAINVGGNNTLVSNGLISADVAGGTLSITPPASGGGSSFVNNGTLQATNGGTLLLSTNITANAGSQIVAGAGSAVVQNGVRINGVVQASGSGVFTAVSSGANFLDGVNFAGTLDLSSIANARERIVNGAILNGAINVANGGVLSLDSGSTTGGDQSITGTAVIHLNDAGAWLAIDGSGTTTLGTGITVRGQGNIGQAINQGGNNTLISNGLVSADVAGGTLNITAPASGGGSSFVNNGRLQAINGGTLLLSTNITANPGSQIVAGAGSAVVQNGVRINGAINVSGSGVFTAVSSGSNVLDGVSLTGALDASTIANARERFVNGATINGVVNIGNGGVVALDSAATTGGDQTISGNAVFKLNDSSARLTVEGSGSTTLGAGVTVRGEGSVGNAVFVGGNNTVTNLGLFSADVSGGTLNIATPASGGGSLFLNQGTLQATGGGVLQLSTSIGNAGGVINAQTGSTVVQNGVTVSGGAINVFGSGSFAASSNGGNFLDGVSVNGNLDLTSIPNSRERIINGMTLNGTINVANGGFLSLDSSVSSGNSQTIGGNGVIALNDAGARLSIEGSGSTTLAAGITVRGQGNIGSAVITGGNNTLFNNGSIVADGGTLTIAAPASGGASLLAGSGTLQTSGGTLVVATGNNSTQGRLLMGAAGSALDLGGRDLTITSDYVSQQWGSGDSFNRRAGISGTGQVLAGGDVVQAVTGIGITGGNTANPVLTVGNLRVGATTFNYQVANLGSSGPTLRGATQTGVNGGNITDARLSGSGVTQGLYSAGGPGSNSGDLAVTFNIASAGVVAPLSGQSVNLTSNFSNIGDQTLSIVMGAGAAAYNAAVGNATPSPVLVAAQRVGGSNSVALTVANTAAAGAFSEDLNATYASATGAATGSGSIAGRLAGTNNTGTGGISVGVNTATSGVQTGTVTLAYQTAGAVAGVSNGLGTASVGSQTLAVSGKVYAPAVAQVAGSVDFGIVRVGDVVGAKAVTVANTASGALVDTLRASMGGSSLPFASSGTVTGLAAGSNNNGALTVALNTATAGVYNGSASVTLTSQNPDMADLALGTASVGLHAQVNNLAKATLTQTGAGSFSGGASSYTLNFGTVTLGGSGGTATLRLANTASGPADALAGMFDLSALLAGDPYTLGGFNSFAGLAAGSALNGLTVSFSGNTLGSFDRVLVLNALSTNGSGPDLSLAPLTLHLEGTVVAVPEPGTWATLLAGLSVLFGLARRRRVALRG